MAGLSTVARVSSRQRFVHISPWRVVLLSMGFSVRERYRVVHMRPRFMSGKVVRQVVSVGGRKRFQGSRSCCYMDDALLMGVRGIPRFRFVLTMPLNDAFRHPRS